MKKIFTDVLDECSAEELDRLLKGVDCELPKEISLNNIQNLTFEKIRNSEINNIFRYKKVFILVAVLVAMFVAVGVGTVYATEIKEYNKAVKFFNDNSLSIEGLSRGEIKEVYRDITTETFLDSNTAKVLEDSKVKGYEIIQSDTSPGNLKKVWNGEIDWLNNQENIYYEYHTDYGNDEWLYDEDGFCYCVSTIESSYFTKNVAGRLLWTIKFNEFGIDGYIVADSGVLVYGDTPYSADGNGWDMWCALISDDGELLWKKEIDSGFHHNYSGYVCENSDGTFLVVGRSDNSIENEYAPPKELIDKNDDSNYMVIYKLDSEGNILHTLKVKQEENTSVCEVFESGDNYIVRTENYKTDELNSRKIIKMDKNGKVISTFSYGELLDDYEFRYMTEYDGKLYISTELRPDKSIYEKIDDDISDEKLLPLLKEEFTAMLFVCDFESGLPQEFYTAKGAFAGDLSTDEEGNLLWKVESIMSGRYLPYLSSCSFCGESYELMYKFDESGNLVCEENTRNIVTYRVH